ncbi:MAG: hypothetical protein ACYSPJ_09415, partial [Planctomycetota bacterium]
MAKKLYVGNLSPKADEATLTALFSMFGTVEKAYLIGRQKGRRLYREGPGNQRQRLTMEDTNTQSPGEDLSPEVLKRA